LRWRTWLGWGDGSEPKVRYSPWIRGALTLGQASWHDREVQTFRENRILKAQLKVRAGQGVAMQCARDTHYL